MAKYRLSPLAKADLYGIWLYGVETWGMDAADSYLQALYQRFTAIAEEPLLWPTVDDIRPGYRRCIHKPNSIYYRIAQDGAVEIMAVLGRQNTETRL
ncbi:type II toxin-antitoxin system RelE/ParE family toxin [Amaricoccus tamworthensis]|uniref:type II toxin-antitoxin system RelE/ParE family toxin n=1 Tax=Amaricoccus tamworthensis TaxID=57002 RepID=UPI003C7B57CB